MLMPCFLKTCLGTPLCAGEPNGKRKDRVVPDSHLDCFKEQCNNLHLVKVLFVTPVDNPKNFLFSRSGGSRGRAGERDREGSAGSTASEHRADRELRWRDRHYSGPRKWLSNALLSVRVAQPHSGMHR